MNLPHRRPVDDDEANARQFASVVRLSAFIGVLLLVIGAGAWQVVARDGWRDASLSQAPDYVAADAAPVLRTVVPTEDDQQQHAYMTHGG